MKKKQLQSQRQLQITKKLLYLKYIIKCIYSNIYKYILKKGIYGYINFRENRKNNK